MKKVYLFLIGICLASMGAAQDMNLGNRTKPDSAGMNVKPIDGYYRNSDIANRQVIAYAPVRQTDVAYRKRVWREIDVREKMNTIFASPNARLIDIIIEAIQAGKLLAYDPTPTAKNPTGDNFEAMAVLPVDQVMARLGGDSVLVEEFNENNEVVRSHYESRPFNAEQVLKFRIKEDWIFDKQRSVFEPRIVGIAPLITPQIPGMDSLVSPIEDVGLIVEGADPFDPFAPKPTTTKSVPPAIAGSAMSQTGFIPVQADAIPAFWIYFPEARHVFVNKEVMNRHNAATGLSYDDLFIKRLFTSYIVKQDNPEDLRIKDYIKDDIERLYESERIKNMILDWEQNLWSY